MEIDFLSRLQIGKLQCAIKEQEDPQVQCGLDKNTSAKFEKTEAYEFPAQLNTIVNTMVDGSVKFKSTNC